MAAVIIRDIPEETHRALKLCARNKGLRALISSESPLIILDTNVVSGVLKPTPSLGVLNWLDRQTAETLYLTSISMAELLSGVARLPNGKQKARHRSRAFLFRPIYS